jgi:hypothetical protein
LLLSPRHLLDRARHPRSRADELARLRARFAAEPARREATAEERALAAEIAELKRALAEAYATPMSCAGCGGCDPYPGGRCCGTGTFVVFSPHEVRALKLAGHRATDLVPPRAPHHGCAFRGERGCSLRPDQRPAVCLVYACDELRAEVRARASFAELQALRGALQHALERFIRCRFPEEQAPATGSLVTF